MTDSLLAPEPDASANDTPLPAAGPAPVDSGAPPPESGAGEAPAPAAEQPVTYEPFTLPDGLAVDQATLDEAQALFAEAKLSQPQAQKLVDLYTAKFGGLLQSQIEAAEKRQMDWVAEVKADPEVGGQKFEASRASARRALARFGTEDLRRSLDELWVGNNPHLFRFFVRVGQAIGEPPWTGARPQSNRPTHAQVLYPAHGTPQSNDK